MTEQTVQVVKSECVKFVQVIETGCSLTSWFTLLSTPGTHMSISPPADSKSESYHNEPAEIH
jgi:hypothetical protein